MFDSTIGPVHLCCVHVSTGRLAVAATVTYALDPDGPVKHSLQPIMMRLCAWCAGWTLAKLHGLANERGTDG